MSASEPDISDDDMGVDPLYTPGEIQRIQVDAQNVDNENTQDPGAVATGPEGPLVEPTKKRRFREVMTSKWWQHYKKGEIKPDGSYDASCIYCGAIVIMGNNRGTGSLRHHFKNQCKKVPHSKRHKPDVLQRLLQSKKTKDGQTVVLWEFNQEKCRKSFARMVIVHEYPFNCVTHHYLRVFLNDLCPEFKLVSRNTLRSDCLKFFEEERLLLYELIGKLDCRVSFTSDLWTNNGRDRGFMALTCHYIDDGWKLNKRILNFTPLPCPHTGNHISQAILDKLILWNLDKKTFCLVLDNASSNDACIKELLGTSHMKDVLPVEGAIFHQRCGCHVLNLIVQDGLAILEDEITKVRETMKYIRHSQARMEKFRLLTSQVKCPNRKPAWDVPTRWNSTYLMLQLALQLKPAIVRYVKVDKMYTQNPSELEWEAVKELVVYLKVFYDATLKLSGTKYPTLNLYFTEFCEVYLSIEKMKVSPFPFVVKMGKQMWLKWDKYWKNGNTLLALACCLDPRCKMHVVKYYSDMMYPQDSKNFIANLEACLKTLHKEYAEAYSKTVEVEGARASSSQHESEENFGASSSVSDTRAGLKSFISGMKSTEPLKSDLEQYLADPLDDASLDVELDILSWWKLKAPRYPILARLTRDILAVPISTVASEATFSTSGRTLSSVRNSLNDESIEALICAQDWLRTAMKDINVEVGDTLFDGDEVPMDGTICGSGA